MLKKINHIGIAVNNLEEAISFYGGTLCMTFKGVEEVAGYKVKVAFFQIGESKIELLEPTSKDSFLAGFLEKKGEGIHHIAYEVEGIEDVINKLEAEGTRMIDKTPRQGAHGAGCLYPPGDSQGS
jgi:methylmalonyl-CoA/ethylmalonyl-CoA epimerase